MMTRPLLLFSLLRAVPRQRPSFFLTRALACLVLWGAGSSLAAAGASPWADGQGGAVRLISSGSMQDGSYWAGLEFALDPGWHTYWRSPGEAGIPPQIDFQASENVGSVTVFYPVPERYNDGYSTSAVYHDTVVLPLAITPKTPGEAVTLNASLFFGVCKDICVPRDAELHLTLEPGGPLDRVSQLLINRDLAAVPHPATGQDPALTITAGQARKTLSITAQFKTPPQQPPALFAEGPQGSYNGLPHLTAQDGLTASWSLSTVGLGRLGDGSSTLTLVLSVDGQSSESHHVLPTQLLAETEKP